MILVADSGSTKTDWRLINDSGKETQYFTIGFNPYFQTELQIAEEIKGTLLPKIQSFGVISTNFQLYYYGAGCSTPNKNKVVADALRSNFPNAAIEVNHDLLAAARALCGKTEGIAAILGTGSNSCRFDGTKIVENVFSLGYIFGDEGSGANIGKWFATHYMNGNLPQTLAEEFYKTHQLTKEAILDHVYSKPMPSKFLASFSVFVLDNISHPFLKNMVIGCFNAFFEQQIVKYTNYKQLTFNCVGSVGFNYQVLLKEVAIQKGITVGKIIASPTNELVKYHLG